MHGAFSEKAETGASLPWVPEPQILNERKRETVERTFFPFFLLFYFLALVPRVGPLYDVICRLGLGALNHWRP